ncbi:MAG: YvcK family protein [Acidimicrobiia bacterium]
MTDSGPRVVAIGGGHGLAAALSAIRTYAGAVTAVVNTSDDGGSSGRLRREYGIPPPGDLRRALCALADGGSPVVRAFQHRFETGELAEHVVGNLVLLGLTQTLGGDFTRALAEAGGIIGASGTVLPATTELVELRGDVGGRTVEGQVAVSTAPGMITRVELIPSAPAACPEAVEAIGQADQVVLAPGSLYTSVLPVLCVPEVAAAVRDTPGVVVQVANLGPQIPETEELTLVDHLRAILDHGGRVDRFLHEADGHYELDAAGASDVRGLGAEPVAAPVARPNGLAHDPELLAAALGHLV